MLPASSSSETEYLSTQTQLFPRKGTPSTLSDVIFPAGNHQDILTPYPSTMNLLSSVDGVTLTWNDLSVYAKHKQKNFFSTVEQKIQIIKNVTGCVPAGSLVAFIGASGAGKSTLMEALAYQSPCGVTVDGDIRVNGRPIGSYMRMLSGFMHQQDIFINTLTVLEHLHFMAKLKLDRRTTHKEREGIVEQLLTMLGLKNCANMFIENIAGKDLLAATVKAHKSPFWIQKLFWLMHRSLLEVIRNPEVQQIRILQHVGVAILVGFCFSGTLENNQKGIQAIQGLLFMVVAEHTFQPMYGVLPIFPTNMPSFLRDYRSGLYTPLQFYISSIMLTFPGVIIEPVVFTAIIYWLTGFTSSWYTLSMTMFIATLCIITATACGCFFSILFDSVPVAMAYLVPFDCTLLVTSGVFIKLSTLSPYLTWLKYISWIMFSNEALSILQWDNINNITCEHMNIDLPCFHNGKEVLDVYSFSEEDFWIDIYALISLIIIFHILGFVSLYCRSCNENKAFSSIKL